MDRDDKRPPELNALKHGGRSTQVIVKGETQEDFDRLNAAWRSKFEMDDQDGESLLERVILNDWLLRRAERNYLNVANELGSIEPMEWTLEQHKKLELFQRYKTTAERAFSRFYNMLRALRRDRFREEMQMDKVRQMMEQIARESLEKQGREANRQRWKPADKPNPSKGFFSGHNSPKEMGKIVTPTDGNDPLSRRAAGGRR